MIFGFLNMQKGLKRVDKQRQLQDLLYEHNLDVLGLNETNLEDEDPVPDIDPLLFDTFYNEDTKHRVAMYAQRRWQFKKVELKTTCPSVIIEGRGITIATFYNEYNDIKRGESFQDINLRISRSVQTLREIKRVAKNILVIGGDININLDLKTQAITEYKNRYMNMGLDQVITEKTRLGSEDEQPSCLDHIYVRNVINPITTVTCTPISDHRIITVQTERKTHCMYRKKIITTYRFKEENIPKELIPDKHLAAEDDIEEIDEKVTNFLNVFKERSEKKLKIFEGGNSFYDHELHQMRHAWQTCRKGPMKRRLQKDYRKKYNEKMEAYESNLRHKKGHAFPPKVQKQIEYLMHEIDGVMQKVEDDEQIANISAKHYHGKVMRLSARTEPDFAEVVAKLREKYGNVPKWGIEAPTEKKMYMYLKNLKNKNSKGPNLLTYKIFRYCKDYIYKSMARMTKLSLTIQRRFIKPWKDGLITNVHKKGSTTDIGQFRPICQTNTNGKLPDKALKENLQENVEMRGLIDEKFCGFRSKKGTVDCLIQILDEVQELRRLKRPLIFSNADQSAAFDLCLQEFLQETMKALGANDEAIETIKSYLEDREMAVKHKDKVSEPFKTNGLGIGQGSYCSTFYWLVCSLSLPLYTRNHKTFVYADDNSVLIQAGNKEKLQIELQKTVESVIRYMKKTGMVPNLDKSENYDPFHENLDPIVIKDGEEEREVRTVRCTKFLGTLLGDRMRWWEEIDSKRNTLRKTAGHLYQICQGKTISERRSLFFGYGLGRLLHNFKAYSIELNKSQRNVLKSAYHLCIRYTFGIKKRKRVSMTSIRQKHKIMSIEEIRLKCMFELAWEKRDSFVAKSRECYYTTRFGHNKFKVQPFVDNVVGARSRMVKLTKIWNKYHEEWISFIFEDGKFGKRMFKNWCKNFFKNKWKTFRSPQYNAQYYEIDF